MMFLKFNKEKLRNILFAIAIATLLTMTLFVISKGSAHAEDLKLCEHKTEQMKKCAETIQATSEGSYDNGRKVCIDEMVAFIKGNRCQQVRERYARALPRLKEMQANNKKRFE